MENPKPPAVPPPPQRQQPLPLCQPKSAELDPDAPARIQALLRHPAYRRADLDHDFFDRPDLRAVRLQLEYLKPQILLREEGVRGTIVVFGGTRIPEPAAAQARVTAARQALDCSPDDPELQRRLAVAERVVAKSTYYNVAREFGQIVACAGGGPQDHRLLVMTGGGPGIMEAANRGAFEMGAHSVGLNITLPHEQFPNPYITPELCFQFRYFALRKMHFLLRARALVAFPGGYGTLDELFEALCLIQTRKLDPLPVILVGESFWHRVFDADFLAAEGVIDPEDKHLFWFAETAEEIWRGITAWYAEAKKSLFE